MNGLIVGKRSCAALTALSVLMASPMASAQEDPKAKALGFYEQAVAAYQKGDYATAASLLERAFAIDPDRDLIYKYNRILALEKMGELQKALDELDPYLEPMLSDPAGRFNDAGELQQRLKGKLAEAKDPNKDPNKDPDKDPNKDPNKDPKKVEPIEQPGPPVLGYTLLGVGGATFVTGLLFSTKLFLPEKTEEGYNDSLANQKLISAVGLIGGALIAGGGLFLVLTHDDGSGDAPSTVTLTPAVGADGVGAVLRLDF